MQYMDHGGPSVRDTPFSTKPSQQAAVNVAGRPAEHEFEVVVMMLAG
jgi:hypothetical protein